MGLHARMRWGMLGESLLHEGRDQLQPAFKAACVPCGSLKEVVARLHARDAGASILGIGRAKGRPRCWRFAGGGSR